MILLQRPKAPLVFSSEQVKVLREKALNFYSSKNSSLKSQSRFNFNLSLLKVGSVRSELLSMSNSKCFYCEKLLENEQLNIDYFRPIHGALGISKEDYSKDHYWWLAYDWENINASCSYCTQSKGMRFPVDGERAKINSDKLDLLREKPLLLNPTGFLEPSEHLLFQDNGKVKGLSVIGDFSIDVYGLNRRSLIDQRLQTVRTLKAKFRLVRKIKSQDLDELIEVETRIEKPFLQLRRQLVKRFQDGFHEEAEKSNIFRNTIFVPKLEKIVIKRKLLAKSDFKKVPIYVNYFRNGIRASADEGLYRAQLIEKIEIKNFKAIENLNLDFSGNADDKVAWKMLLGENGVGKTSILQAVALVLAGKAAVEELGLKPNQFVTNHYNAKNSQIKVFLTGEERPLTLEISKADFFFENPNPQTTIFAYGSVRLLERSQEHELNFKISDDIKNLFDPTVRLHGIHEWLLSLGEHDFNEVSKALKNILSLSETAIFLRKEGKILIKEQLSTSSFYELSDGYQSLIALSGHLMRRLLTAWPALDIAEGIVLIDEIGAHMHPRWKLKIVASLREAFPRIQFLCTTHDPLCLRGMETGEVEVVEKNSEENKVFIRTNLPEISGMRIDQILQSEHFGLNSTIDPKLELLHREYYLLLKKTKLNSNESKRVKELRKIINQTSTLGNTRREQIAFKYIDEYISDEKSILNSEERAEIRETTRNKVLNIIGEKL